MTRGSQCTRFEVHTVDGREDMYNLMHLMCYKGGALWDIIQQYTTDSSAVRTFHLNGTDMTHYLLLTEVILNLTISQGIVVVDNECTWFDHIGISLPVDYGGTSCTFSFTIG